MFDLEERLAPCRPHPAARALVTEQSSLLWEPDVGPLGTDGGADAFHLFVEGRASDPDATLGAIAALILEEAGEAWALAPTPKNLAQQFAADAAGDLDIHLDVLRFDETLVATALAQLFLEGRIDPDGKRPVAHALERLMDPRVVFSQYPSAEDRETRHAALREATRLVAAAPARTTGRRPKQPRAMEWPWDVDEILVRRIEGQRPFFLHTFAPRPGQEGEGSGERYLLVLDWRGETLPDDLDAIDARPAKNLWKFTLSVPPLRPGEDAAAWEARVTRTLERTGRRKVSTRAGVPCSLVAWESLDEHLLTNWEW